MDINELSIHEKYMSRCIEIAKKNSSKYYPNPSVGALIVKNDMIIAEGVTSDYGCNHAEVNAINSIKDPSDLIESTLYVTLEPCSHFGKTPPCVLLIHKSKIKNVVIGTLDNSSKVNGKGVSFLKEREINVITGILEKECKKLHRNFLHFNSKNRPYIILKWARTKDNFIAPLKKKNAKPFLISSLESRQLVHKWRSEEHSIMVGFNTIISDNPHLDARYIKGNNPVRIILDDKQELKSNYHVFNNESNTLVISKFLKNKNPSSYICNELHKNNIQSVIVEGGRKTLDLFIKNDCWDEARIFESNQRLDNGIKGPEFTGRLKKRIKIGNDYLKFFKPF